MLQPAIHSSTSARALPLSSDGIFDNSPSSLREHAAYLVGEGHTAQARALIDEGLKVHPQNEHLLVMRALLCEVQRDWAGADQALQALVDIPGYLVPEETWTHWVRVQRCRGHMERALSTVSRGLLQYPQNEILQSERETLLAILRVG